MCADFVHKKSLGQHFLNSDVVPRWLVDAATLAPKSTVLEIGPGTGALTKALLADGHTVIALEADARALAVLQETFAEAIASQQLTLVHTDVRELNLEQLGLSDHSFAVVANIPYYLSGHLFRTMLQSSIQPHTLVFLVQKEVAKRVSGKEGDGTKASLLSLAVSVYGDVTYVRTVSRGHFTPPPKVDSGIVAVHHISRDNFTNLDEDWFFTVLHAGFGQKRKQLQRNLRTLLPDVDIAAVLKAHQLPADVRAEDVPLTTWLALSRELATHT